MACLQSYLSSVEVSDDGGATYVNLGEVVTASVSGTVSEFNTTTIDQNGISRFCPGNREETMSVSMIWNDADAGQNIVVDALRPSVSIIKVRLQPESGVLGTEEWEADAFCTSYSPTLDQDDVVKWDLDFRLSEVDIQPQV